MRRWAWACLWIGCGGPMDVPDASTIDAGPPPMCFAPESVALHGACRCAADCAGSDNCATEREWGWPHGSCVRICSGDADCAGGPCLILAPGMGVCQRACSATADCRTGYRCVEGVCSAWCIEDSECESGHCNPYTHQCYDGTPPTGGDIGAHCLDGAECRSGLCDDANLDHRCDTLCLSEAPNCPTGSSCVLASATSDLGLCLPTCTDAGSCDNGLDCVQVAYPPSVRACLLQATAAGCRGRSSVIVDGAPCGCADDCTYGASCLVETTSGVPHGLCIHPCDAGGMVVRDEPRCGDGELCHSWVDVPLINGGGACFPRCASTADCPAGRVCSTREGCVPLCQADAECESGLCDRYRGWCFENTHPERGAIGAACASLVECRSGQCRSDGSAGFCTARCDTAQQLCPDGAVCVDVGDGALGLCMPACTTSCAIAGAVCMGTGSTAHCDLPGAG